MGVFVTCNVLLRIHFSSSHLLLVSCVCYEEILILKALLFFNMEYINDCSSRSKLTNWGKFFSSSYLELRVISMYLSALTLSFITL